ncbi:MAG: MBL fold metallo-hydrolase [Pseudomonadota bacterium]|nr:MBL fold metallo-hydrolase [Pseudomonadota bacterium]
MTLRIRCLIERCLAVAFLLVSLLALGTGAARAAETFTAESLADNLWLVTGPSGNTLIANDSDGLILIEGVPAEYAGEYLAFAKRTAGTDTIKALVNTHWHPESAGLNASLREQGVDVIAHFNTMQWLGATIRRRGDEILHTPVPAKALPNRTFHDTLSIPFRGATIELGYLVQAHTDGDVYAWFPAQKILYTGPAVRSDTWSAVDEATNGWIGGLMDGYDELAGFATADVRIVPASGPVLDKAGFEAQMTLYKDLMAEMVNLLRQSRSAEEVVIANPAVGLKPEWGAPDEFLDEGFRSFYGHLRDTRHVGQMP